jgi:hypothetical protein
LCAFAGGWIKVARPQTPTAPTTSTAVTAPSAAAAITPLTDLLTTAIENKDADSAWCDSEIVRTLTGSREERLKAFSGSKSKAENGPSSSRAGSIDDMDDALLQGIDEAGLLGLNVTLPDGTRVDNPAVLTGE